MAQNGQARRWWFRKSVRWQYRSVVNDYTVATENNGTSSRIIRRWDVIATSATPAQHHSNIRWAIEVLDVHFQAESTLKIPLTQRTDECGTAGRYYVYLASGFYSSFCYVLQLRDQRSRIVVSFRSGMVYFALFVNTYLSLTRFGNAKNSSTTQLGLIIDCPQALEYWPWLPNHGLLIHLSLYSTSPCLCQNFSSVWARRTFTNVLSLRMPNW